MHKFNSVLTTNHSSFDKLSDFIYKNSITRGHEFGFRGHSNSKWELEPTITRFVDSILDGHGFRLDKHDSIMKRTINSLHSSFRNNLIANSDLPEEKIDKIDLWQYGQHFGLPTPLLDWTHSPFIALFFALENKHSKDRCLWVLNLELIERINKQVIEEVRPKFREKLSPEKLLNEQFPTLSIVSELNESNRRKTFQQGFFTRHDYYRSLDVWLNRVTSQIHFDKAEKHVLEKHIFKCSERERIQALDVLDKMNINHRTLFPDVFGSVQSAIASTYRNFSSPTIKTFNFSSSKFD